MQIHWWALTLSFAITREANDQKPLSSVASLDLVTHGVILEEHLPNGRCQYRFTTIDLQMIQNVGQDLSGVAQYSSRSLTFIRLMRDAVDTIQNVWTQMINFGGGLIMNFHAELDKIGSSVMHELTTFMTSGRPRAPFKHWLVNTVTESVSIDLSIPFFEQRLISTLFFKGYDKWKTTTSSGYLILRRFMLDSFVPTCDEFLGCLFLLKETVLG
jgi:hypothetical protein